MTTRRVPVPQSLPGGLTLDQLHALYGRLDILRDDLSGLFEDGYLPSLRAALNVELARIYGAMLGRDTTACQPGRHRPDCGFASEAELAELDGLRADALEHEQAAVYEEIAEAELRAAWGDR